MCCLCVWLRTVRDVASETARECWRLVIATIKDFDIVAATGTVDLVIAAECVAAQSVGATFQIHLCEMNIYGLSFRGSNAHTAVEVVSTEIRSNVQQVGHSPVLSQPVS